MSNGLSPMHEVEIYVSGGKALLREDTVTIRIGKEVSTMTAGEWSRLLSSPKKLSELGPR